MHTSPLYDFCLRCLREGHCSASCKQPMGIFTALLENDK